MTTKTTPEQRQAEFRTLFDRLPGPKNADRIRQAAKILHLRENSIRIYRMANPPRVITDRSLAILRAALPST